jgi:PAS domain S-box-containing protein
LSDRYEAEERRRLITHVFDHSSEAIVILDDQHRVVDFNKAVTTITGYTLSDVKGLKGRSLARGGESDSLFDTIENQMTRDGGWHGELTILRKEGPPCPVYCNVTPIRDEAGKIINWGIFVTDLSERKASEARLESLANIDQLTRLPNRPGFAKRSATGWPPARRAPSSLSMSTNWHGSMTPSVTRPAISCSPRSPGACAAARRQGHPRPPRRRLVRRHRRGWPQPGRPGNPDPQADRLGVLSLPFRECGHHSHRLRRHHPLPQDGDNAAKLLRNADLAMHSAKEHGLSSFRFFDSQITEQRTQRLHMENDLRWVLLRRELTLHYQPQVTSPAAPSSVSKACCAGTTPNSGAFRRIVSSRWRKKAG